MPISKHKRKKTYTFKGINPHSATNTVAMAKPINEDSIQRMLNLADIAMIAFKHGVARITHYDDLALMLDIMVLFSSRVFGLAYAKELEAAQNGMRRSAQRYKNGKKLGFDGLALTSMTEALQIYHVMLSKITAGEYMEMVAERRRMLETGDCYQDSDNRTVN